ncbi:MAG: DUF4193 domain-containing protein [Actinobacteria bacterium]|nr:DUF4193 domain-containing protein [Actinomycetota bacterium]
MTVDYDAPRRREVEDNSDEPLADLATRRGDAAQTAAVDVDEDAEDFVLPDADLSGEELSVRVIPMQANEFTCSSCFLVHHRSQLARQVGGRMVCADCA